MSPPVIGVLGIVLLLLLFVMRVPIAFSMLIVGAVGYSVIVSPTAGLALFGLDAFSHASMYTITVIPMFILAGGIAFVSGLGNRLFNAAYAIAGRLPGSLCIAATVGCAGFGAICGSSSATAAAMGKVAMPAMRKFNYNDALSSGSIAAAGTLAVMIPPSTVFIVYAVLTEQSVGKLFVAGILPGILLAILFSITVLIQCLRNPSLAPRGQVLTKKQKMQSISGVIETFVLFVLVIGGLSLGWFSPTQAGGILVIGVSIVSIIRRQINFKGFLLALKDSARLSCMNIFIIVSALIFGRFMAISKIPFVLADLFAAFSESKLLVIIIVMIVYMIGGCFMDGLALVVLTMPIIFPTIQALNIDPIWFGVLICVVGELGMITPPVGINVYVLKGVVEDVPLGTIFRGVTPFIFATILCMIILMVFPQISTFLPGLITY